MKPTIRSSKLFLRALDSRSLALVTGGDGDPIASNREPLSAGMESGCACSDVVEEKVGTSHIVHKKQ
jgi:hypothetical protein